MKRGNNAKRYFALSLFLLGMACAGAAGKTIYVDDDAPADFNNIQAAIDDANHSNVIVVKPGTYTGDGNRDIDFLGKAITVQSIDPNEPNIVAATIINCNGTEDEPHRGFYFHSAEDASSILDGLTITNGWAHPGDSYYSSGGAVLCENGSPTIRNCIIKGNLADRGGAIYCSASGNPTVDLCTISSNTAENSGGGIYCSRGSPKMVECAITGNSAKYSGGGLCSFYSMTSIQGCKITGNSAKRGGGITCRYRGEAIVNNCVFKSNSASAEGGAVFSEDNRTMINSCLIAGNSAENGGGISSDEDEITIRNCLIAQNAAHNEGGGIWCWDTTGTVKHCTIADNSADSGGGITHASERGASLQLMHSILWDNTANYGRQIAFIRKEYSTPGEVSLTISYCNLQGGIAGLYFAGEPCLEPYCTGDVWSGNINADPLFVDPASRNYRLLVGSPCMNTGDPEYIGSPDETDLDGQPRVLNWRVDMGAYENIARTAHIGFSPIAMDFRALQGGPSPEPLILTVGNCGPGSIYWQITESCPWLQVAPTSDESVGERDEVTVSVDSFGLHRGLHTCELIVTADDAPNSPQTIIVRLHIGGELHVPGEYETIQAAIDVAVHGDAVVVAPGTYTGEGNGDIDFHGKAITVTSTDPNDPNVVAATVIDGRWEPPYCHHGFIFRSGEGRDSVIEGLTVMEFRAADELISGHWGAAGGGVFCRGSSPTISRCVIKSNSTWWCETLIMWGGGGIWCDQGGSPRIVHCTFIDNYGNLMGGAIHCQDSNAIIDRCTITENWSDWDCGGISCYGGITVTNCTITNNHGGAISCGGNSLVSHCVISGNTGEGGICIGGNGKVSHCSIVGNSAQANWMVRPRRAGGIYCTDNVTISRCLIAGNWSESYPGDELGGRIAGNGGGVYCYSGNPSITSCTITDNSADDNGGGIYSTGNPVITNCIVWSNASPNEPQISGEATVSYGDIEAGWPGTGNIDGDPYFAQAGYWADKNDRDIAVQPNDPNAIWVDGDYHLKSQAGRWDVNEGRWAKDDVTSPCIDAGDPMSPIGHEPFPNGGIINMGAYGSTAEASKSYFGQPPCETIVAGDINGDCKVDFKDFTLMASHWLKHHNP